MTENIFFNVNDLRSLGSNVIIGKTVRIRYPELVHIGDNVIIDDFTYISTALIVKSYVHIASGCKLIGGRQAKISLDDMSTLAPNVVVASGSDDYVSGLGSPLVPKDYKGKSVVGTVSIGRHCIIGANSTILPNVVLNDGAAVGAQSLVKSDVPCWSLYAGIPARFIKNRNRDEILRLEKLWREANER